MRSAHRTPDSVAEYAKTARERGLKVLICGAGLAAALPGAVAAHTDLPVIGVPLRSSLSVLDGLDALLAIAQMPPGVPVAAVGVDNAKNAAALAIRILNVCAPPGRETRPLRTCPVSAPDMSAQAMPSAQQSGNALRTRPGGSGRCRHQTGQDRLQAGGSPRGL